MRNLKWTRDELILSLDLYSRFSKTTFDESHPEVIKLCDFLNTLPIHQKLDKDQKFRNPNGVKIKMRSFLRFDLNHKVTGLSKDIETEREVWDEFHGNRERLSKISDLIRQNSIQIIDDQKLDISDEEEFIEGKILTKIHYQKERNSFLIKYKKKQVISNSGKLECEICSFDFYKKYGDLGFGFCECHHNVPILDLEVERKSKLSDLSILCSNCHRMIHRTYPLMLTSDFKKECQF
ncbi:MAG: HNH endonuclease [Proteobacteria bacterium]|nr:HNH endonuclease [Pseudomonadota bacterium]